MERIEYLGIPFTDCEIAGWQGAGWYFWDESDAYCHGPYTSFEEADEAMYKYALELDAL
jgi:hypothetical protein